jgi:hypothetical protein
MSGLYMILAEKLRRKTGLPDAPCFTDAHLAEDISPDNHAIPTGIFHDFNDIDGLLTKIGPRKSGAICQRGPKPGQGIAALIRARDGHTGGHIA